MNNTRNNGPELDYYELRRRHEQYKSRSRAPQAASAQEQAPQPRPVQPEAVQPEREELPIEEPAVEKKVRIPFPAKAKPAPRKVQEELDEELMDELLDEAEDEESFYENPNPFSSFISFFNGVKGNISKRGAKKAAGDDPDEDFDRDFEEGFDGDFDDGFDGDPEAAPAKRRLAIKAKKAVPEDLAGDVDPEEMQDAPVSRRERRRAADVQPEDFDDMDDFDEDFDGEFEDGDAVHEKRSRRGKGGFGRFMSLFVARVDENGDDIEEDFDDMDDYDEDFDEDFEEEDFDEVPAPRRSAPKATEGEQIMDEMNKSASPAAAAAESTGMSRRERRELAMRKAAEEEAARRAAEEAAAAQAAEEAAAASIYEEAAQESGAPMETSIFTPVSKATEEAAIEEAAVEEPTREFRPVSREEIEEDPFDLDDEEEEDDKPRMGFFARRRAKKEEIIEDDEDDYDDDYDDEDGFDEDEDEEEEVRPAKSRKLFGRRKKAAEPEEDDEDYDDEDDYDEDDDYDDYDDDEDEDDEYDEYDDDEDEFDDEDEGGRSFGHHLVGALKIIAGVIGLLAVTILVLNFLYVAGHGGFVSSLNEKFGGNKVFQMLFPCCGVTPAVTTEADVDVTDAPLVVVEATETPAPAETAPAIPDFGGSAAAPTAAPVVEQPVIEAAPVVTQAPAQSTGGTVG